MYLYRHKYMECRPKLAIPDLNLPHEKGQCLLEPIIKVYGIKNLDFLCIRSLHNGSCDVGQVLTGERLGRESNIL